MIDYHVCRKCDVPHYDNCGTCFGFGCYQFHAWEAVYFPLRAGLGGPDMQEERDNLGLITVKCPECGSNANGVPEYAP